MAKALTTATCEKAKPAADRYEIADGLLVGLRLTVQPSGVKSWCVRTRISGRPVKYTLGVLPTIGVAKARELGRDVLIKAKAGINPLDEKREKQRKAEAAAGNTLKAICEEYMTREGGRLRTAGERQAIFTRLIYPSLGRQPIEAIKRSDIIRLLDRVEDECGGRSADMVLSVLRRVMNWHASRSDEFRSPIVRGMARHKAKPRERKLSDAELVTVWKAAEDAGAFGRLVQFLLLTSARRSEAAKARWDEIDGTDWVLPARRNKTDLDLVRPLSPAAQALLASIPQIEGCPFIFTAGGSRPIGGYGDRKERFDRATGVSGWRLHDLRRTARSLMSRAGVPSDHAERCLGHVIGGVRGTYDRHEYHAEKKLAFEKLATLISKIVEPQSNVVPLYG